MTTPIANVICLHCGAQHGRTPPDGETAPDGLIDLRMPLELRVHRRESLDGTQRNVVARSTILQLLRRNADHFVGPLPECAHALVQETLGAWAAETATVELCDVRAALKTFAKERGDGCDS